MVGSGDFRQHETMGAAAQRLTDILLQRCLDGKVVSAATMAELVRLRKSGELAATLERLKARAWRPWRPHDRS
jgi:hypothetical protein